MQLDRERSSGAKKLSRKYKCHYLFFSNVINDFSFIGVQEYQLKKNATSANDSLDKDISVNSNDFFHSVDYYSRVVNEIEQIGWHKLVYRN